MSQTKLTKDNHYVPESYLKRWADSDGKVWTYRLLVAHEGAGLWKPHSPKSIAYHEHLYTRVVAGQETDDFERWLHSEFESPAGLVLPKAVSEQPLTDADWRVLIRFLAAQDVRTPARLTERLRNWHETMPDLLNETMVDAVRELEAKKRAGIALPKHNLTEDVELFPVRATIEALPGGDGGQLRVDATIGRKLWLWSLKNLLSKTLDVLTQHEWTILRSPQGLSG